MQDSEKAMLRQATIKARFALKELLAAKTHKEAQEHFYELTAWASQLYELKSAAARKDSKKKSK